MWLMFRTSSGALFNDAASRESYSQVDVLMYRDMLGRAPLDLASQ